MCADRRDRISASAISGFPEWSPSERLVEQRMLDEIRAAFERFGFSSIETPAVERNAVLTAKGGEETVRQIYALTGLHAQGGDALRDYSLHFDLTVPLARYVAQRSNELVFPFRRYQMQKVWRGERPQHGRFREFTQCDIDIVGDGKLSLLADAEIPAVIDGVFTALNIGDFVIRISNRKILTGYLEHLGFSDEDAASILREADKIERQGEKPLRAHLEAQGASTDTAVAILTLVQMAGDSVDILERLAAMRGVGERFEQGVAELSAVFEHATEFGIPQGHIAVDLGIVRGLDYYTGTIYETRLVGHPQLGSICSGGRYDDLASYFTGRTLPGVGISIGWTRLFSQLLRAGIVQTGASSGAQVLVTTLGAGQLKPAIELASMLRARGVDTELYIEDAGLRRQLRFAARKGIRFVVIPLPDELERCRVKLRDMHSSEESTVSIEHLADKIIRESAINN